ncbi:unnamed protein product [Owenia fusiformis]|uniref:Uncharacterized protein n=1 Tax=Owenia fusiformis TaxID=6347 RepID=A0A8S4PTM8_OWEFU|nr:unnamed protein product [Owenia fusiformis]
MIGTVKNKAMPQTLRVIGGSHEDEFGPLPTGTVGDGLYSDITQGDIARTSSSKSVGPISPVCTPTPRCRVQLRFGSLIVRRKNLHRPDKPQFVLDGRGCHKLGRRVAVAVPRKLDLSTGTVDGEPETVQPRTVVEAIYLYNKTPNEAETKGPTKHDSVGRPEQGGSRDYVTSNKSPGSRAGRPHHRADLWRNRTLSEFEPKRGSQQFTPQPRAHKRHRPRGWEQKGQPKQARTYPPLILSLQCEKCSKVFPTAHGAAVHRGKCKNGGPWQGPTVELQFVCTPCGQGFRTQRGKSQQEVTRHPVLRNSKRLAAQKADLERKREGRAAARGVRGIPTCRTRSPGEPTPAALWSVTEVDRLIELN